MTKFYEVTTYNKWVGTGDGSGEEKIGYQIVYRTDLWRGGAYMVGDWGAKMAVL